MRREPDQGETGGVVRRRRRQPPTNTSHSTRSSVEGGGISKIKCFARIYRSVNASDGQLSRLHVSIRSEFCVGSDVYLLIQQHRSVSRELIDSVEIPNGGWS